MLCLPVTLAMYSTDPRIRNLQQSPFGRIAKLNRLDVFKGTNNKRGRPSISLSWIAVFVLVLCTFAIQCLRSFMFVLFASFALRVVLKSFYVLIFLQWAEVKARANLAQLVAVPVQHKLSLHIACIPSSFLPVQDKLASLYRPSTINTLSAQPVNCKSVNNIWLTIYAIIIQ